MNGLDFILRPRRLAARIKQRPRWLVPLLILCAAHVAIFELSVPSYVESVLRQLPDSATQQDRDIVVQHFEEESIVQSALVPIRVTVGCLLDALALWFVISALSPPVRARYSQVFSCIIYADFLLLGSRIALYVGMAVGGGYTKSALLQNPLSLAALVPGGEYWVRHLLNQIDPFFVWYVILVAMLISGLTQMRWRRTFAAVAAVNIAWLVTDASIVNFLMSAMHLQLQ